MTRRRSRSRDLPAGVVRVGRSPRLYVTLPAQGPHPATRLPTPWTVDDPEGRTRAAEAADVLRMLRRRPQATEVFDALRRRAVSLEEVVRTQIASGLDAATDLLPEATSTPRAETLWDCVAAFAADTLSLHPNRRGQIISPRTRHNDAGHVRTLLQFVAADRAVDVAEVTLADLTQRRVDAYVTQLVSGIVARRESVIPTQAAARDTSGSHGRPSADHAVTRSKRTGRPVQQPAHAAGQTARRKHLLALRSFLKFVALRWELPRIDDPTTRVIVPAVRPPRQRFLLQHDCERLVATLAARGSEAAAVYCTILHCSALDSSDVARLRVSDIDPRAWTIESSSQKTRNRDRTVTVLPWGRARIAAWCVAREQEDGPHAPLFAEWSAWRNARDPYARLHRAAVEALVKEGAVQFTDYQPRDSRHSVAVQMARAGVPLTLAAAQLGSSTKTVGAVYARWAPTGLDWEQAFERLSVLAATHQRTELGAAPEETPSGSISSAYEESTKTIR